MKPVLTSAEMAAVDEEARGRLGLETLVAWAGFAVARTAVASMGGTYGRRVVVVAGKGHNGDDGRVAAAVLARRGAQVTVDEAADAPGVLGACDLVIDAAYGTRFHGEYSAPRPPRAPSSSPSTSPRASSPTPGGRPPARCGPTSR